MSCSDQYIHWYQGRERKLAWLSAFPESSACASQGKKLGNIARTSAVQTATAMMLPGTPFLWSSESSRIEPERDPKTAFSGTSSRSEKTSVRMWMLFRLKLLVDCAGLVGVGTQMSRVLEFDCEESKLKSPGYLTRMEEGHTFTWALACQVNAAAGLSRARRVSRIHCNLNRLAFLLRTECITHI